MKVKRLLCVRVADFVRVFVLIFVLCELRAEKITLPIKGFETLSRETVMIEAEWNEQLFGEKPAFEYNHDLARIAALLSTVSYTDVLSNPNDNELLRCYRAFGIQDEKTEFHYDVDYESSLWGNDQSAFSFAVKQIESAKGKRNLIFIVIRGTPLNANEWISNLNVSNQTKSAAEFHEGFFHAEQQVKSAFTTFLLKNKIDTDDCFLFITGHSRGGAIANLLAVELIYYEIFDTNNIYAYTFASPNVTTNSEAENARYNFIWNIVNGEDVVPTVPMNLGSWNYKKFGNTLTLINAWNVDQEKYKNDYLPRMNVYFKQFLLREFSPFMTGPFIPIQVGVLIANLNKSVDEYYKSIRGLHNPAENIFRRIFQSGPPAKSDSDDSSASEESEFLSDEEIAANNKKGNNLVATVMTRWMKKHYGENAESILNSFIDMHAMEGYLSWMLALEEDEAFSTLGMSVAVLEGNCDFWVFDDEQNIVATVIDGKLIHSTIKRSFSASQIFSASPISVGIPANKEIKILITKESLIPTKIKVRIEHYSSSGELTESNEKTNLYPYVGSVYLFSGGEITLEQNHFETQKITGEYANLILKAGRQKKLRSFDIFGITSFSSNGSLAFAAQGGNSLVSGTLAFSYDIEKPRRSIEFSQGIGTQVNLTGPFFVEAEFFSKLFFATSDEIAPEYNRFNFVPALRFSLLLKSRGRFQLFGSAEFESRIDDFNEAPFDSFYREDRIGSFSLGKHCEIFPNFLFGLKVKL